MPAHETLRLYRDLTDRLFDRGLDLAPATDEPSAEDLVAGAARIDPSNAFIFDDRVTAYEAKGELDRAITDFRRVIGGSRIMPR